GVVVGVHDVVVVVAVEVGDGDADGPAADLVVYGRLEGAVAVVQQDADRVGVVVGRHEVGRAVAVEVAGGDGDGLGHDGVEGRGAEEAEEVPVLQQLDAEPRGRAARDTLGGPGPAGEHW